MRCPADERVLSSVHPALIDIGARPYRSDMGTWVHGYMGQDPANCAIDHEASMRDA